jgi:hypothetical protein
VTLAGDANGFSVLGASKRCFGVQCDAKPDCGFNRSSCLVGAAEISLDRTRSEHSNIA